MTDLRIGSLCTGYGGLDLAVMDVLGGSMAWHCQWEPPDKNGKPDRWQYAARILAHHWPAVPNYGDITAVDWSRVEPVQVLTMGFPCTDVSAAGLRAGIAEGTRSGVWFHCARAIDKLRPSLVVIENVEGLLSARADRGMGATDADVEAAGDDALRALGCVLGDLADIGFDAEWCRVAASDVGAPHRRYRIFILAWTAANPASLGRSERWPQPARILRRPDAALCGGATPANTENVGHERCRSARDGWPGPANGDLPAADTDGGGLSRYPECHGTPEGAKADHEHRVDADGRVLDWRQYGPAVARWERVLGRPAPSPVDDRGRLSPWFVEWMMGLPEGHVCGIPAPEGMTAAGVRNAQLKALGNGVVPQQAAFALRLLLARVGQEVAA